MTTRLQPLLAALLLLAASAQSAPNFSRPFVEKLTVGDRELVRNGQAIRKATFLKIKIYEAALYLPERRSEASAILASSEPKAVELHFLRDVSRRDLSKSWSAAFASS